MTGTSHDIRPSSRPIIAKIEELAIEADEAGYPIIAIALLGVTRVSRLDLPEDVCRAMAHSSLMCADAVQASVFHFRRRDSVSVPDDRRRGPND